MTAEIVNTNQLKTFLSHQITKLSTNLKTETIPLEAVVKLLKSTLKERQFLLAEIDHLRSSQQTYESVLNNKSNDSVLILSEIEENLYNDFQNFSRKLLTTDGELLSILMRLFLNHFEDNQFPKLNASELIRKVKGFDPRLKIQNHKYLRVTNDDLQNLNVQIDFNQIDTLILDISLKNFVKTINSIKNCQEVHIPFKVSKLIVYARTSNCQEIHLTPPLSEPILNYVKEANQVVEAWENGKKINISNYHDHFCPTKRDYSYSLTSPSLLHS
ncbi:hypothetical protein CEE45_08400 [Candidatus Heimdallarchaeota archaeon B3_Heim]|nr:MAG: hypothetical protein CEE45_08400 [Candidatus Heimdallarchaeota archaeon B3_Heim]